MYRFAVFLAAAILAMAPPAPAQLYSVTGVASGDRLNIRTEIDRVAHFSEAEIVGDLAPGAEDVLATGRSFRLGQAVWREIVHTGGRGWVNARFLRQTTLFPPEVGFRCGGTEPFWDIVFDAAAGSVSGLGVDALTLRLNDWRGAVGRQGIRAYHFTALEDGRELSGIQVFDGACSDGMSDLDFAWSLYLLGLDPEGGVHHACCSVR
jgi:uncharacterized membrane protein